MTQPAYVARMLGDSQPLVVLRQIAGLTSGGTVDLQPGRYAMGQADKPAPTLGLGTSTGVGFTIEVDSAGDVYVEPGDCRVRIGGDDVRSRTMVTDDAIDVGSARFVLDRPATSPGQTPSQSTALRRGDFDIGQLLPDQSQSTSHVWSRPVGHPQFGEVTLALGDRAPFGQEVLRSVPIISNLATGSVGIAGDRQAILAVTRALVVALTTLTPPNDLTLAVLAGPEATRDWSWADRLPHNLTEDSKALPLVVVDGIFREGVDQLSQSDLRSVLSAGGGAIYLASTAAELPDSCRTTMVVKADGSADIFEHTDVTSSDAARELGLIDAESPPPILAATPIGLTEALAEIAVRTLQQHASNLQLANRNEI